MPENTKRQKLNYSQRMGLSEIRTVIQKDDLDKETRIQLWNLIGPFLREQGERSGLYHDYWFVFCKGPYEQYCGEYWYDFNNLLNYEPINRLFDIIEFLVDEENQCRWNENLKQLGCAKRVPTADEYNAIFREYLVGYRLVNGQIVPVTDEEEVQALETCFVKAPDSVKEQLEKALHFLANREKPDYAQSVHCAISAVESQCRILLGNPKVSLGQALGMMEKNGVFIHRSLQKGFSALFGFTSDAPGIRHGGTVPSNVDADLAKCMLIISSAFINYLRSVNSNTVASSKGTDSVTEQ